MFAGESRMCINDKGEVMYGFTYPESLNEDALVKEALKRWMDGIEKEQNEQRQQEHMIGLAASGRIVDLPRLRCRNSRAK